MTKQADRKAELMETISGLSYAYRDSRVLLTAVELGLFAALAEGQDTAPEVASRCALDPRAAARLMDGLVVLGILGKDRDRYLLDEAARALLVPGGEEYQGSLHHAAHLWHSWSTLTDAVRAGTAVRVRPEGKARAARTESFIQAMHHIGTRRAPGVVERMPLAGVKRVLDVGGASGAYAMEFVRRGDGLSAAVFDLPEVLPLTRRYLHEAGMEDRVETIPGDYRTDGLGEGWDLIFLSNVVHINGPAQNADLVARGARALAPGGILVIQDMVPDDDRTGPRNPVLFALHMLVNTEAGDTYTLSEMRSWTDGAGLEWLDPVETEVPSTLVMAQRPS